MSRSPQAVARELEPLNKDRMPAWFRDAILNFTGRRNESE